MAAEAISPASFDEAQHHDEYIDYSEDEAAAPTVTAQGSNHNSFSANAHVVTEVSEDAGRTSELDNQTIETVAVENITVAGDAPAEGSVQESVGAGNMDSTALLDSAAVIDEALEGVEDASFNDNEISWEDGPNDDQAANQTDDDADAAKRDEQLAEEQTEVHEAAELPQDLPEEQEQLQDDSEVTYNDLSGYADAEDADRQETLAAADGDSSLQEQVVSAQDADADGVLHEIDYFEDANPPADLSLEVAEAQEDSHDFGQDDTQNAQPDQDGEDHAMAEGSDSASQHEAETDVVAIDDDANDQDVEGQTGPAEENAITGEDLSAYDRMEYEDELLASVQSPESDDAPSNDDSTIPAITVIYKGVEYPFFYNSPGSEGKECFFDDMSLLHCKMEGVLAGFRRELSNELGPLDDLVFQIDELGLEFTESTQTEMFSDITLGQIISVFDSLVKNGDPEDPDASKPLYAFLTTRPNCKKRWLSLVEDAYDGKGLDEVCYHFASPVHSDEAEPEILDDEPGMIGEEDNADAAAWPKSPGESQHGDQDDDPGDVEEEIDHDTTIDQSTQAEQDAKVEQDEVDEDDDVGTGIAEEEEGTTQIDSTAMEDTLDAALTVGEDLDAEATMVETDVHLMDESTVVADIDLTENNMSDMVEDQEPQPSGENGNSGFSFTAPCFYPQFCLCLNCASISPRDEMEGDNDSAFASLVRTTRHIGRHQAQTGCGFLNSHFRHLHSRSDASIAFSSTAGADDSFQAPETDTSNPLIDVDTDGADLLNFDGDDQNWPNDEDSTAIMDQIIEATDENSANKVTPNTSATSTLNGDEVTYETNDLDMNADVMDNDAETADAGGQNDELGEIDWREFPGQGEDEIAQSPPVVGKRPRSDVDDLLDDEAEKDVKRRRP